ncbi:MAG TPA: aldo/keto reductase [Planctomycetaceae bacterium]|nr:aldo/keto reductase [Planctomycetaceae bacterium]
MQYRWLGTTGIQISAVSFGAGPVPALLTRSNAAADQRATVRRAIEAGINWFDTAATYGDGRSELALGQAFAELGGPDVHIATKVRLSPEGLGDIRDQVLSSVEASLRRLQRPRVTLIQLHNSITARRGDLPTSITPHDVLGPAGVLAAFEILRRDGLALHCGLTGLGETAALREVVRSGGFQTVQTPYHLLNPSAGTNFAPAGVEADYGNIIGECARMGMGVLAIRVFAAGALAGQPPSDHTRTTKFFPLAIYESDARRAAALARELPPETDLKELAVRFSLSHPGVSTALIGFSLPEQIDHAAAVADRGPLQPELLCRLERWWQEHC